MAQPLSSGRMPSRVSAPVKFAVGDRVKLSGRYLASTGQARGSEGQKTWTITAIDLSNNWAIVDEPASKGTTQHYTADEIAADPSLLWRRLHLGNLVRVGQVTERNCP